MSEISIQFHAIVQELRPLVRSFVEEERVHLTLMNLQPFSVSEITANEIEGLLDEGESFRRLLFTVDKPCLAVGNELEFLRLNPNHLRLDLPRLGSDGLAESWLCAKTSNPTAFDKWKSFAKRLKSVTESGVTAVNRSNGVSAFYPRSRFTSGAKALEASGIAMLPATGTRGPRLVLGQVQ